jgi:hypothetical protein
MTTKFGSRNEWLDYLSGRRSPKSDAATRADARRPRCWCGCEGGTPGRRPYSSPISSGTDAHRAESLERALRGQPVDPWHDAEVGTVTLNASAHRGGRRA